MTAHMKKIFFLAGIAALVITGCSPDEQNKELGALPDASFTATPIPGMVNRYLLTSTSSHTTQWRWDNGDGSGTRFGKAVDTAYFPSAGSYTIKLLAMGQGGIDSASQSVTVAADDPNGCVGLKAVLTGCASKTWKIKPAAGALRIGPPDLTAIWWENPLADVTARSCTFNDRFTFTNTGSVFNFNNQGDIWVEDENGAPWPNDIGAAIGCHPITDIAAQYRAWGSGTHSFSVIGNSKIRVAGTGAFLGIYKAGDNGTTAGPESSITYDVVSYSATSLVIRKNYSWGTWEFHFVPE
ncbi:MAG: hypothetical protein ABS85_08395 [Sphingobacteriales bacterium SCN 48-20]|jgi:hypothetical protein|nr:MAG: hypothetical protein ABS85_08395 [Sphingobacteriales bacterium SCN 48-20]